MPPYLDTSGTLTPPGRQADSSATPNDGYEGRARPNVRHKGKKLAAAKSAIRHAHCAVAKLTKKFSSKVKKGRVISQKPVPGKKLAAGSKVKLTVS